MDTDSVTCLLQVTPGLTLSYPPFKDSPKAASDFILGFGFSSMKDSPGAFLNSLCTASDWNSWWFSLRPGGRGRRAGSRHNAIDEKQTSHR